MIYIKLQSKQVKQSLTITYTIFLMGNAQSSPSQVQVYFHQKFKTLQLSQQTSQMILCIPFQQRSDISQWQKLLEEVKNIDSQFLLVPKKYFIAEQGICGSSGIIKIVYDSFTYSFQEEIKNHADKYKHFQEPQVWYLLFAMISSVIQMDRLSLKVGDIRPYNIFVNDNGQVKMSGIYSWPKQIQNFLKTSYDKTITYLAPEQLLRCRTGQKIKFSYIIGQSFSIGLTLLHTCLLRSMDGLYNIKKFDFNSQKLVKQIEQLKKLTFWNQQKQTNQSYSHQLITIIEKLLDINQTKRLNTLQLFTKLQPHAQQILNLRQFQAPLLQKVQITPTKDQSYKRSKSISPQKNISQQYSSIKRKQFNQGESIGLQMSNGFGSIKNPKQQYINKPIIQHFIPQQKKFQSPSAQHFVNPLMVHSRKVHYPQQNPTSLSKQKYQSNPIIKFNNQAPQPVHQSIQPSIYYVAQPQQIVVPSQTYVNYQVKYQGPTLNEQNIAGTERASQNTIANNGQNYPFANSVSLATSGYTYRTSENHQNFSQRFNHQTTNSIAIIPANQVLPLNQITQANQATHANKINHVITQESRQLASSGHGLELDFLKKIDQQLNKSKLLYPSSNM